MPHRVDSSTALVRPAEAEAVRSAIAKRDLPGVEQAFSRWLEREPSNRFNKNFFVVGLADAIKSDQPLILSYLLSQDIPFHNSHIRLAIERKSQCILEAFLENGWNINSPVDWSTPPLLCEAIHDENLAEWFLKNGADPNAQCDLDYTPLSVAVASASFSTVKLLFTYGGTVQCGQLLYHAATRTEPDRLQVLAFILFQGAEGMNALLHQHRPNNFEMLKPFGLGTPLHAAAEKGLLDTVQYLLNHGADPWVKNSKGQLAKDCAQYETRFDIVNFLSVFERGLTTSSTS